MKELAHKLSRRHSQELQDPALPGPSGEAGGESDEKEQQLRSPRAMRSGSLGLRTPSRRLQRKETHKVRWHWSVHCGSPAGSGSSKDALLLVPAHPGMSTSAHSSCQQASTLLLHRIPVRPQAKVLTDT